MACSIQQTLCFCVQKNNLNLFEYSSIFGLACNVWIQLTRVYFQTCCILVSLWIVWRVYPSCRHRVSDKDLTGYDSNIKDQPPLTA
jgi:hypothetical protein